MTALYFESKYISVKHRFDDQFRIFYFTIVQPNTRRRLTRSKSDGGMEGCESTVYGLVLPYPSLGSVTIVTLFSLALQHRAKHFML